VSSEGGIASNGKNYKMRTTIPNNKKHMINHDANLKNLIETVDKVS